MKSIKRIFPQFQGDGVRQNSMQKTLSGSAVNCSAGFGQSCSIMRLGHGDKNGLTAALDGPTVNIKLKPINHSDLNPAESSI